MGLEKINLFWFNIAMCENTEVQSSVSEYSLHEKDDWYKTDSDNECVISDSLETGQIPTMKFASTDVEKCNGVEEAVGVSEMTINADTSSCSAVTCNHQDLQKDSSASMSCPDTINIDSGGPLFPSTESKCHSDVQSNSYQAREEMNNCDKLDEISQYSPQHPPVNDHTQDITSSGSSKQDIVISPVTLKQDLQLSLEDNKNRMSQVLENISLVYLPNTKQLISKVSNLSDKSSNSSDDNSDPSSTLCSNEDEFQCTDDYNHLTLYGDTVANCDLLDSPQSEASLSAQLETSDLLGTKDEDQLTCHSLELCISRNASDSLLRTFNDNSSLSSLSTYTDISISTASANDDTNGLSLDTDEALFMDVNLHTRNSFERTKNDSQDSGIDEKGAKSKKRGLSGFISRNLFSRKKDNSSVPGWKLFGKIPPKHGSFKEPSQICAEYQARQRTSQTFPPRHRKHDLEVLSTTALILENRPMNLPSKDPEEAEKHRQEYEEMVEAARRKEQKELKLKKKRQQRQLKQEDLMVAAVKIWNSEILPNWDTAWESKRASDFCWLGIPPSVRGKVWLLAIGNELNVTPELYEICESRAEDKIKELNECELMGSSETSSEPPSSKESSVELIKLDVSRTFPQLCIFQKGGPYHDLLHSLLGAYVCYRPDVGYVQGMSFIAAVLLLNMDVADSFICFCNLLNRPCQVAFFRVDETLMKAYFNTFEEFLNENLPNIHSLFRKLSVTPDLFIIDWIFTMFTRSLPLDVACRVWDNFCRDGEEFLFRTAIGILRMYGDVLMSMDFIHLVQFLTRLPENIDGDRLFRNIDVIKMTIDKKKFAQVLALNRDREMG